MPYAARAILAAVISVAPLVAGPAAVAVNATQGENLGGPFTLVDQDGRQVTDTTWRGKWLLLYFGYTHCPDICPMALSNIAEALDHLGSGVRARLQPIFITVDPARDSPEVLRDYVKAFEGADIVGLSGTDAQVAAAEAAYHVRAQRRPGKDGEYTVDHSGFFYVVDPDGHFAGLISDLIPPERLASRLMETMTR